jgi:hypothetical protein
MKQIIAHIKLDGGKLLSAKNAHRIVARSTKPTDRSGNTLDQYGNSPTYSHKDEPPYFQQWIIKKEKKGFIFRERSHYGGICGHSRTVRQLVIQTLTGLGSTNIIVEVTE